jgi:hypothetical protein
VVKLLVLLAGLAILWSGCADSEPTVVYQYEVQGKGENVAVTYVAEDHELIDEEVSLPWTSEEFEGTRESTVRLEVDGPEGSTVKCILRYRRIGGDYGGNGSGERSQYANPPSEDLTVCALNQGRISQ